MRVRGLGLSGQNLAFWITYETGLYKKYGLTTEMVISSGELDREGFLKTLGK